eukprot:941872_1
MNIIHIDTHISRTDLWHLPHHFLGTVQQSYEPMDQYCLSDRKNKIHSEFNISFWNKQTNDHAMTNDQYEPYHTILKHIELVDRYIILHEDTSETVRRRWMMCVDEYITHTCCCTTK